MNTVTDMSYGSRLFIWLSANRLFPQPNDIDIDQACENCLEKNWSLWVDILRALGCTAEIDLAFPTKQLSMNAPGTDILDDGKSRPVVAQALNVPFLVNGLIVFHIGHFADMGLSDEGKYREFLLKLLTCLQTIHSQQLMAVMGIVQQSTMGPFPPFGAISLQPNQPMPAGHPLYQPPHQGMPGAIPAIMPLITKLGYVSKLLERATHRLALEGSVTV